MPRVKRYIDTDVYTEAKKRIHHIFDLFDNVVVMFSGGKDSLVCLHMTWEVAQERGIDHVNVVFRDEELIPDEVIDFIDKYRQLPWVRMLWYAVPLKSHQFVLGVTREYVQWDASRRHVRPIPEWAITSSDGRVFDQYTMDAEVAKNFKGRLAFITGVRASESLVRYRSVVNKLNENYICTPVQYGKDKAPKNVKMAKPIYDWEENDVFKYFYDNGIEYCHLYDAQLYAGMGMRVSTPLHAESAKRFDKLRETAPVLYQQVIDIFPEMILQERYYRDYDRKAVKEKYGKDFDGVLHWINEHLEGSERETALYRLRSVKIRAKKSPAAYPPEYVLNTMMSGSFKREILPKGKAG